MLERWPHKFYDAHISVGLDGSMLVSSSDDRMLAWGLLFCLSAAFCLIVYLLLRRRRSGRLALGGFGLTLLIPVFVMPSIGHEYIHVTPERLTIETGDWYRPSRTVVPLSRRDRILERSGGFLPSNLIGDPDVSWHFRRHDGRTEVLELNDFFNAHRMVVAYYIKDRGFYLQRLEDRARNR